MGLFGYGEKWWMVEKKLKQKLGFLFVWNWDIENWNEPMNQRIGLFVSMKCFCSVWC